MGAIRRPFFWLKCVGVFVSLFSLKILFVDRILDTGWIICPPHKRVDLDESLFQQENFTSSGNKFVNVSTSTTTSIPPEILEKMDKQKVVKVIILSVNPRSGSSYLSEILASPPETSYWQEPLRYVLIMNMEV